jgi:hypothetical protein
MGPSTPSRASLRPQNASIERVCGLIAHDVGGRLRRPTIASLQTASPPKSFVFRVPPENNISCSAASAVALATFLRAEFQAHWASLVAGRNATLCGLQLARVSATRHKSTS